MKSYHLLGQIFIVLTVPAWECRSSGCTCSKSCKTCDLLQQAWGLWGAPFRHQLVMLWFQKKINLSICTSTAMKSYECRLWNQNLLWNPMGTWLLDCLTATSKTIVASPDVGHCYESWETSARPKMYVRPSHQMESIPESAGTMGTMIHLDSPNIFSN